MTPRRKVSSHVSLLHHKSHAQSQIFDAKYVLFLFGFYKFCSMVKVFGGHENKWKIIIIFGEIYKTS